MLNGMLENLKAVIFDLDGVLFDSKPSNVAFYNHILEKMNLPPMGPEDIEVIHRESSVNSLRHLVGEGEPYDRAMDIWKNMDPSRFISDIALFPNARQCLDILGKRFVLAVATNRALTTRQALEHFGLWDLFKVVSTPVSTGVSKPHPKFMDTCLGELGMNPEQVVYVGDSSVDDELCQVSGVRLIAFQNNELDGWAHVDDLVEIPALLGVD
jgi:phosphoglycolate phosphatase